MSLLVEPSRIAFGLVKSRQLRSGLLCCVKVRYVMLSRSASRQVMLSHGSLGKVALVVLRLVTSRQITAVEFRFG
jgi:hypothetical protein